MAEPVASRRSKSADNQELWKSTEWRMLHMKVAPCHKRYAHDWSTCPYSHPRDAARRRDPRVHPHTGVACPAMKQEGSCANGDSCPFAHNVFEYWLHPTRYRTQLCNDGEACKRWLCFFAHNLQELRVPECKPLLPAADGAAGVSSEASGGGKLRNSGSPAPASLQAQDQPESAAALQPQQQPRSRRQGRLSGGAPLRPSLDMALPSAADAATHHALSAALKQPARQQPSDASAVVDLVLGLLERGDVTADKSAAILQRLLPPAELGELQERLAGKPQQRASWDSWAYSDARAYLASHGLPDPPEPLPPTSGPLASPRPELDALFAEQAGPSPLSAQYSFGRQAAQPTQHLLRDLGQLAALQAAARGCPAQPALPLLSSSAAARLMANAARADSRASSLDVGTPRLSPIDLAAVSPGTCPSSASLEDGEAGGLRAHAAPAAHVAPAGDQHTEVSPLHGLCLPGPSLLGW